MTKQLAQLEYNLDKIAAEHDIPGAAEAANPEGGFGALLSKYLGVIMVMAALLLLLYLVWGSVEWITSEGDKGKLEKARNKMMQAIIGIIVLAASIGIFNLLQNFLGINVLMFN